VEGRGQCGNVRKASLETQCSRKDDATGLPIHYKSSMSIEARKKRRADGAQTRRQPLIMHVLLSITIASRLPSSRRVLHHHLDRPSHRNRMLNSPLLHSISTRSDIETPTQISTMMLTNHHYPQPSNQHYATHAPLRSSPLSERSANAPLRFDFSMASQSNQDNTPTAQRAFKPNPLMQTRDAATKRRRDMFFKRVQNSRDDKKWETRGEQVCVFADDAPGRR
jgi:hypothetical protein